MTEAISVLGLLGIAGCFDMAMRMNRRTRHAVRFAMFVIAIGCAMAAAVYWHPHAAYPALLTVLAGCGLFRLADRRVGEWHGHGDSRAGGSVAGVAVRSAGGVDPGGQGGDGLSGSVGLATCRARDRSLM